MFTNPELTGIEFPADVVTSNVYDNLVFAIGCAASPEIADSSAELAGSYVVSPNSPNSLNWIPY